MKWVDHKMIEWNRNKCNVCSWFVWESMKEKLKIR